MFSSIQLINTSFSHIELIPSAADKPNGDVSGEHQLGVQRNSSEDGVWHAKLILELKHADEENPTPYTGKFVVIGKFKLDPNFPEETAEQMVQLNAGSLLYGTIREMVINLTSRSLHGPARIPTLDARTFLPPKTEDEG